MGLFVLLASAIFSLIIITDHSVLSGGSKEMNEEYEAKLFVESALRLINDSLAGKEIFYTGDMGLAELEMRTREAGTGAFHKYLAHGLYRLEAEPDKDYMLPFIMRLESQSISLRLDFIISAPQHTLTIRIKEVCRGQETLPLPEAATITFVPDLYTEEDGQGERILAYRPGVLSAS